MSFTSFRHAALSLVALGTLVAACSDSGGLAPPDGSRCTAGSLAVGDTVRGEVTAESCLMWMDYDFEERHAESWTLRTAKDKVYIVRMVPVAAPGGANTLDGVIYLYGRNASGDPVFLTSRSAAYGAPNVSGGLHQEMIVPSRQPMTLSVRVASNDFGDAGSYTLSVMECPLLTVNVGTTSAAVAIDGSCSTYAFGTLDPSPAAFFSFDGEAGATFNVTGTRTAGTSNFGVSLRGPGVDFGCWLPDCNADFAGPGAGPLLINAFTRYDLDYTVAVYQDNPGTLSASVAVARAPVPIVTSTSSQR